MWTPAPEAQQIAKKYIKDYHKHLASVLIIYVFTDKPFKVHGGPADAKVQKISGIHAWLAAHDLYDMKEDIDGGEIDEFILMTIDKSSWDLYEPKQREALIDHELCHVQTNPETGKVELQSHDVEEFKQVIVRHGLWREDIRSFFEARQPALTGMEDALPGKKNKSGKSSEKVITLVKDRSIKEAAKSSAPPKG